MRFVAVLFTFLALMVLGAGQAEAQNIDIWADSVTTAPGQAGAVSFRCYSNVEIFAITIPVRLESSAIIIDSVHFSSVIPRSLFGINSRLTNSTRRGLVSITPTLNLAPLVLRGDEIFRVHYHVKTTAAYEVIPVDTFYNHYYDAGFWITEQIQLSDAFGNNLYPDYTKGAITVDNATAVDDDISPLPLEFTLDQNYPNPFNPTTTIGFTLPQAGQVSLEVFDILGRRVATLVDEFLAAGRHEAVWNADSSPSGLYFYRLTGGGKSTVRKMTLIK